MKLLILTSAFPPEAEGAATHLPEMAAALQKNGHRVQVLAVVNRHEVRDSFSFRVKRISRSQVRLVRDLRVIAKLFKEARRCDAFYVYGIWWQAALVAFITRIPLIVKFTGDKVWEQAVEDRHTSLDIEEFQLDNKNLALGIVRSFYRLCARLSTRLVVSCDALSRVLMHWGIPRDHIEIVPNALPQNPRDDEQATYLAQWNESKDLRLITAGHITHAKQLEGLLNVLTRLENVKLVVAGDGPDLNRIKKLTFQFNLAERVLFTGKVSRQDLTGYIGECDILILNSRIGRFNYAILEALAHSKPILATRRGLHPDFIEHGITGWLYPNNDTEELYKLLSNIQQEGQNLPEKNLSNSFSWQQQVEMTEDILKSLET